MIVAKKDVYLKNSEDVAMTDCVNVVKKRTIDDIKEQDSYDNDYINEVKMPGSISMKKTKKKIGLNVRKNIISRVHNTRKFAATAISNNSKKNEKKVVGNLTNESKSPNSSSSSSNRTHRRVTFHI